MLMDAPVRFAMSALVVALMLYAALCYVCGRFTARHAIRRGRSARIWFVVGSLLCLLFPLADLVLALLPVGHARKAA
jgi:hypothetical protein